ncbi:MAG: hypothetical protein LQ338_007508, partial [Usnochroma carphineum]
CSKKRGKAEQSRANGRGGRGPSPKVRFHFIHDHYCGGLTCRETLDQRDIRSDGDPYAGHLSKTQKSNWERISDKSSITLNEDDVASRIQQHETAWPNAQFQGYPRVSSIQKTAQTNAWLGKCTEQRAARNEARQTRADEATVTKGLQKDVDEIVTSVRAGFPCPHERLIPPLPKQPRKPAPAANKISNVNMSDDDTINLKKEITKAPHTTKNSTSTHREAIGSGRCKLKETKAADTWKTQAALHSTQSRPGHPEKEFTYVSSMLTTLNLNFKRNLKRKPPRIQENRIVDRMD